MSGDLPVLFQLCAPILWCIVNQDLTIWSVFPKANYGRKFRGYQYNSTELATLVG